jgi:hypothetical protein
MPVSVVPAVEPLSPEWLFAVGWSPWPGVGSPLEAAVGFDVAGGLPATASGA